MRILFRLLLNQALFLLSFLIPKRKGLVVLGAGLGLRFMGNPKYLYLHMLSTNRSDARDDDFEFYWISESQHIYNDFHERKWPVLKKFSLRGFWSLLRAQFLIIESGMMAREVIHDVAYAWLFFGRFNVIQTWHGSPMKRICLHALEDRGVNTVFEKVFYRALKKELSSLTCVIAQSQYDQEILSGAFANREVPILGSARTDVFFRNFELVEKVRERFSLDSFEKIILYAPTYRESKTNVLASKIFDHRRGQLRPFSDSFLIEFDKTLRDRNWLFLVKKHHLDRALTIPGDLTNIMDVGPIADIQELLVETDLLISDYSSVCFDYVLANRPIIYYVYDLEKYLEQTRSLYLQYSEEIIGPFAKTELEVAELVFESDTWFSSPAYQETFKKFQRRFQTYNDGRACDRLLDYLKDLAGK